MLSVILQTTLADAWTQIGQAYTNVWLRIIGFLPELVSAFFVIFFTWLTVRFVKGTIARAMATTKADHNIQTLVVRAGVVVTWLIGITVMISVLKVDAAGIFAALGLTGAALGFAIRDIIANFIAGVVLLSIRPFKIGDSITIETFEGVVEDLAIRATVLKTIDGKEVTIPNSKVFNAVVIKHSMQSSRRVLIPLGIAYESSFEQVKETITSTLSNIDGIATDPPISINITTFSGNGINLEIMFWVKPEVSMVAISNQAKLEIKEALHREQVELTPSVMPLPVNQPNQSNKKPTEQVVS